MKRVPKFKPEEQALWLSALCVVQFEWDQDIDNDWDDKDSTFRNLWAASLLAGE